MIDRNIRAAISIIRKVNDWLENSRIGAFIGAGMMVAFWYVLTVSAGVLQ